MFACGTAVVSKCLPSLLDVYPLHVTYVPVAFFPRGLLSGEEVVVVRLRRGAAEGGKGIGVAPAASASFGATIAEEGGGGGGDLNGNEMVRERYLFWLSL